MRIDNKQILILGVGNTLLGDEGFGVHAVEYLREHYAWPANARLVDGGTLGLMLMAELLECDLAIVLDIALGSEAPGAFYQIDVENMDKSLSIRQSAHQISLADTLISCELAGHKPEVIIYAMQPYDYQTVREELTPEAKEKLPLFCAKVATELCKLGVEAALK